MRIAISLLLVLATGCVSSELQLARDDLAHPGTSSRPLAPSSGVLTPGFDPLAATPPPPDAGAQKYTCPMHPEIIKDEPGTCPICKMKLVPVKEKHSHPHAH